MYVVECMFAVGMCSFVMSIAGNSQETICTQNEKRSTDVPPTWSERCPLSGGAGRGVCTECLKPSLLRGLPVGDGGGAKGQYTP